MKIIKTLLILILSSTCSFGQVDQSDLTKTILYQDSLFWTTYNTCDIDGMEEFLTEDLEFYHDKAGLTKGLSKFTESVKNGLCSNLNSLLKREAVEGTVQVFQLSNFGAIISGEHIFYRNEKGKNELAEESARFTHIWKLENDKWKMSRVLSYDHQPVPYQNKKTAITVSEKILTGYVGKYNAPQTGEVTISKNDNGLEMQAGKMQMTLYPQSKTLFFHKKSSLTFEFVEDVNGSVIKMIVRENGNIVEEAKKIK